MDIGLCFSSEADTEEGGKKEEHAKKAEKAQGKLLFVFFDRFPEEPGESKMG